MTTETVVQPTLIIAPNLSAARRWCMDNGIPYRAARPITREEHLRGVWDRELVVVNSADCNPALLSMARYREASGAITLRWEDT